MRAKLFRIGIVVISFVMLLASCRQINDAFQAESPRHKYVEELNNSLLAQNALVQQWITQGDSVLNRAVPVELPFRTQMVYFSDEPNARAWTFNLPQGRTFRADIAQQDTTHQLFVELYSLQDGEPQLEQTAEDSLLSHTLDEDQKLVLRVQPELLVAGSATITFTDNPSMKFPVSGGIRADIGSFWGDPRDGGARKHKGVDIFANRGTPVVAVANGRISRSGNRGLGGKQVWLRANGKSMYYAHLDSINASMLQNVQQGDTVGFVGNSGNARTTPTHLHFSIYDRGAINPLPFIDFSNQQTEPISANPLAFSKWGRIAAPKANVRPLPSTQKEPIASLKRHNPVRITGATGEWYAVQLPDGTPGFIYQSLVAPASNRLRTQQLTARNKLYHTFASRQSIMPIDSVRMVEVFGSYQNRQLAKFQNHWVWLDDAG